ncbi:MAG: hypothetical protein KC609_25980 [Myxococcales bacterium]|nr:hypothetical protein [Myxococcales bacterium]
MRNLYTSTFGHETRFAACLGALWLTLVVAVPARAQLTQLVHDAIAQKGKPTTTHKPAPTTTHKPAPTTTNKPAPTTTHKPAPAPAPTTKPVEPKKGRPTLKAPTKPAPKPNPDLRGGIYDRPYIYRTEKKGFGFAIGGYTEMLGRYSVIDGVSDGFHFEARRLNLFIYSKLAHFMRLTAEVELAHGTKVTLQTALLDILILPYINVRAGIFLVPIGRFNLSHDAPRYDIIDRPLVATKLIPSTYADVGVGIFGAFRLTSGFTFSYEIYVHNGLGPGVVGGSAEGTRLVEGRTENLFALNPNGSPAISGRLGFRFPFGVELGLSGYTGIYNAYTVKGFTVDGKRRLSIVAFDFIVVWRALTVRGEAAYALISVPESLRELYATRQFGAYVDVSWTFWAGKLWFTKLSKFNIIARGDWIDLNIGKHKTTGQDIGDENLRITVGVAWRPVSQTSIRLAYQQNWLFDAIKNRGRSSAVQLGVATYF